MQDCGRIPQSCIPSLKERGGGRNAEVGEGTRGCGRERGGGQEGGVVHKSHLGEIGYRRQHQGILEGGAESREGV